MLSAKRALEPSGLRWACGSRIAQNESPRGEHRSKDPHGMPGSGARGRSHLINSRDSNKGSVSRTGKSWPCSSGGGSALRETKRLLDVSGQDQSPNDPSILPMLPRGSLDTRLAASSRRLPTEIPAREATYAATWAAFTGSTASNASAISSTVASPSHASGRLRDFGLGLKSLTNHLQKQ